MALLLKPRRQRRGVVKNALTRALVVRDGMTILANDNFAYDNFAYDSELLGMNNLLTQVICKLRANR